MMPTVADYSRGRSGATPPLFPGNGFTNMRRTQRDALGFFTEIANTADIASFRQAHRKLYITSHPEAFKQVLGVQQEQFPKTSLGNEILRWMLKDGLLTSQGDAWKRQNHLLKPIFKGSFISTFGADIQAACSASCERLAAAGDTPVLLQQEMMSLTLDIIGRILFGDTLLDERPDTLAFRQTVDASNHLFRRLIDGIPLPPNRITPTGRLMLKHRAIQERFFGGIIEQARADRQRFSGSVLDALLTAADDPDNHWATDDHIRDQLLILLAAGHETTTNALAATWYFLAHNPRTMGQLREEWREVLSGEPAGAEHFDKLVFTQQVLKESMRLIPPVWITGRGILPDTEIMGYTLKPSSDILLLFHGLHRNPEFWDQPEQFRPERFAKPLSHKFAWLPFGGGRRICIGSHLAMLEATLALATLGQRFDFEMQLGYEYRPEALVTQVVADGLPVTVRKAL